MPDVTRQLLVDWNGDGSVDPPGPYEDVTADLRQPAPVTMRYGRDQVRELSPLAAGRLQFTLDNQALRYSQDNASSPLYGLVVPNRLVVARATASRPLGYAQTVRDDHPVGYWRLGEATGTAAADASGNGNTGTYTGGVSLNQAGALAPEPNGTSDAAASFDGATGYVVVPDAAPLRITGDITVEAWVRPTGTSNNGHVLAKGPGAAGPYRFVLLAGQTPAFVVGDGTTQTQISAASTVPLNQWTHVAVVRSGSTVTHYKNGVPNGSGSVAGQSVADAGTVAAIGRNAAASGGYFVGLIDEVAVYNTALSPALVLLHYQAGLDQTRGDTMITTWQLFRGSLTQPDEHGMRQDQNVAFQALDALGLFNARFVETPMYTSIRSDQAIAAVLDALGWPAGARVLDTGASTFARWWASGVTGFEAIRQIVLSEGPPAVAYVNPDTGDFHFEGRHYRLLTTRCLSSQAVLRDTGTEPCYSRSDPRTPIENIVNSCTVNVRSYAATPGQALTVGGPALPLTLPPGGSTTFPVTTTADAFDAAVPSVTYAAGSGTASLDRASGRTANLTVTAGAGGCTISAVAVTATTYAIGTTPVSNTLDASASIAKYGVRPLPSDYQPVWISDRVTGAAFCDYVVSRYQERVKQNTLGLVNLDPRRLYQGLARRVSDRVTVVESRTGESADYFVEQVTWQWLPGGQFEADLGVERAAAQAYWRLGVAGLSELGLTTRLSF